ncbi:hypothetical protein EII38_04740 [Streptococcus minor]|uniref:Uncharacterized protein n=1 Tax=Streptococcus minor TaxID=229549 RepID=A0A3P1VBD6_9STRE|nr:hypothetical protein [Streptococcus minor]RRD31532.1 hypothetical protein EII38_04740 [Streptococcus minor]
MFTYRIQFSKGLNLPDLSANPKLADILTFKIKQKDWYIVKSKVNDTVLRKILMEEYDVAMKDVVVVSTRISFGAATTAF